MAGSMQKIAKRCFPGAMQVVDRFHVSKLVYEAVQDLRIAYRWQVMKEDRKSTRLNSSHIQKSRMPSSA